MTTPIAQIPKPETEQYRDKRKLFLVPSFLLSAEVTKNGQDMLERYWSEVRDHIHNLERSLGTVSHIYHELVSSDGDEALAIINQINPNGASFIKAMCQSGTRIEALEDEDILAESSDWQRCVSMGLISQKVLSTALEGFQSAQKKRFEHISSVIDKTLNKDETGVLFIREEHRVQFPTDVQVFYVAPPALDALKRWIDSQVREMTEQMQQTQQPSSE